MNKDTFTQFKTLRTYVKYLKVIQSIYLKVVESLNQFCIELLSKKSPRFESGILSL